MRLAAAKNHLAAVLALALPLASARCPASEPGAVVLKGRDGSYLGVKFRVWAPGAEAMAVAGDFNGWDAKRTPMAREGDSGMWVAGVPEARPGQEYLYLVDGRHLRKDPRARKVTDSRGNSVIYDVSAFEWGPPRPSSALLSDMVVYQLHVGAFFDPDPGDGRPGTFADAIRKLGHLRDLGVNVVLLMPVAEFSGARSWGYNPSDPFAVESSYGGPDGLKEFVKACHEHGLAVHLDVVHNHYGPEDLHLKNFDPSDPYFYPEDPLASTPWGPRPHFGRAGVADYILDNIRMWFDEYRIDGLRWDSVANIRAAEDGRLPNPEGERLLTRLSRMIRGQYPGRVSIAEDAVGDSRFDSSWEYAFHHSPDHTSGVVPELLRPGGPDLRALAARLSSSLGFRRVIYTENHDETGQLNGNRRLLRSFGGEEPLSLESRRRAAQAVALPLTSVGIPLLFMGQEMLEHRGFHDDVPLDWQRGEKAAGFVALTRDLIRLRRNLDGRSPSLGGARLKVLEAGDGVLAFRRYRPGRPAEDLLVVYFFGKEPGERRLRFPQRGTWERLLDSENPKYGPGLGEVGQPVVRTDPEGRALVTLGPFSVVIFGLKIYEAPLPEDEWNAEDWLAEHAAPPAGETGAETAGAEPAPPETRRASDRGPFVLAADFTHPRPWARDIEGLEAALVEDHVWQLDLVLDRMPGIAFQMVNPRTGQAYGAEYAGSAPMDVVAVEDGPPARVTGPLNGGYRVTFNERTLRLRFEPRMRSEWQRIAVAGSFNNWSRHSDPMAMAGEGLWKARIEWPAHRPLEFIFVADGSLETQWGGGTHLELPASGTASPLGGVIRLEAAPEDRAAWIEFDETNGKYTITPESVQPAPLDRCEPVMIDCRK